MAFIERTAYPHFHREPSARDLQDLFTVSEEEAAFGRSLARSDQHFLAVMTLLKCLQHLGYFPTLASVPLYGATNAIADPGRVLHLWSREFTGSAEITAASFSPAIRTSAAGRRAFCYWRIWFASCAGPVGYGLRPARPLPAGLRPRATGRNHRVGGSDEPPAAVESPRTEYRRSPLYSTRSSARPEPGRRTRGESHRSS